MATAAGSRCSTSRTSPAGQPVVARWDPLPYSPIHYDDINAQVEPLLDTASVPATIVNWAGDVPVTVQNGRRTSPSCSACDAEVVVEPVPGASVGSVGDHAKRTSITGLAGSTGGRASATWLAHIYPDRVKEAIE